MACVAAISSVLVPATGAAYEFEVRARTIGQGLQLRVFRPLRGDLQVDRRRFTQTLSLSIWSIGEERARYWSPYEPRRPGPRFSLTSSLRIDHDFAAWTSGTINTGNRILDAIDAVPELEEGSIALDVLSLYVAAEDLLDGRLDVFLGRQIQIGALEWWSFDGVAAAARPGKHAVLEGFAGLRVRDSSLLGSSTTELDGTASGQCREYVEGAVVGSGAWRPIDVGVPGQGNVFRNDFDVCPQRDELMPTFGGAVATEGLAHVTARLSYRRSISRSPGLIGPVDRLDEPDVGFYPNEVGQAPGWGVNEEKLTAVVRGNLEVARVRAAPYAAVRYSVLHGLVDEAHAGASLRLGRHAIEPEIFYSFPTFDGDSIFNVFSVQPYWDTRLTYSLWSAGGALSSFVRPWLRHFAPEDPGADIEDSDWAGGLQASAQLRVGWRNSVRVDGFWEDGYGGRRVGSLLGGRWQPTTALGLSTRLSVIDFEDQVQPSLEGTNLGAQLGATYVLWPGVGMHLLSEYNHNRFSDDQLRIIAILDLAFRPEL